MRSQLLAPTGGRCLDHAADPRQQRQGGSTLRKGEESPKVNSN
jgi:hypothetical protein